MIVVFPNANQDGLPLFAPIRNIDVLKTQLCMRRKRRVDAASCESLPKAIRREQLK